MIAHDPLPCGQNRIMSDASAIGGWILAAAVVAALAGGAGAASGSGSSSSTTSSTSTTTSTSSTSSGGSGTSAAPTTSVASTTGTTGATRAAAPCTRISTVRSTDGTLYRQFPVSAAGSYLCGLERGDTGRSVMAMQQALAKCSDRTIKVDGIFGPGTQAAVENEQHRQGAATATGVYGPQTAKGMLWPWFTDSTNTFTGHCGPVSERSG